MKIRTLKGDIMISLPPPTLTSSPLVLELDKKARRGRLRDEAPKAIPAQDDLENLSRKRSVVKDLLKRSLGFRPEKIVPTLSLGPLEKNARPKGLPASATEC